MSEKTTMTKKKRLKFILFTLAFLALLLIGVFELALYFLHYPSASDKMKTFSFEQAAWWRCDSITGPNYLQQKVDKTDSLAFDDAGAGWYYDRLKIVNNQGYHDRRDFTPIAADNDSVKILFAGDSFTWGASAAVDSSYVEIFKSDIAKAMPSIVWNTGVPATGTNHALFTTQKFLPLQKSNYVILGFYVGNDFNDNLTPYDRLVFTKNSSCYNLYDYDKNFTPIKLTKREAFKKLTGYFPPEELNVFQKIMMHSRFVTFVGDMKTKLVNKLSGFRAKTREREYTATKEYVKQLNEYAKANGAELIVLPIPDKDDMKAKTEGYLKAIKIFDELKVKYFETVGKYNEEHYKHPKGSTDTHWNSGGHVVTGHALASYFIDYVNQKK
jgi:hypothetical protein